MRSWSVHGHGMSAAWFNMKRTDLVGLCILAAFVILVVAFLKGIRG